MTVQPRDIDRACRWFSRHSGKVVFFGRLAPAVRTLISVPAGIAGMGIGRFLFYSALGTLIWTSLLAAAGYWLGEQHHPDFRACRYWRHRLPLGATAKDVTPDSPHARTI